MLMDPQASGKLPGCRVASIEDFDNKLIAAFIRTSTEWETADNDIRCLYCLPHHSIVLVDSANSTVLGTAVTISVTHQTAFMCYVVVGPEHRKRGYAKYMVVSLIDRLRAESVLRRFARRFLAFRFQEVQLVASPAGFPVYDKLGFTVVPSKITLSTRSPTLLSGGEGKSSAGTSDLSPALAVLSDVVAEDTNRIRETFLKKASQSHGVHWSVVDGKAACCWGRENCAGDLLIGPLCANNVEAAQIAIEGVLRSWNKGDSRHARALVVRHGNSDVSDHAFEACGFTHHVSVPLMQFDLCEKSESELKPLVTSPRYLAMTGYEMY